MASCSGVYPRNRISGNIPSKKLPLLVEVDDEDDTLDRQMARYEWERNQNKPVSEWDEYSVLYQAPNSIINNIRVLECNDFRYVLVPAKSEDAPHGYTLEKLIGHYIHKYEW